MSLLTISSAKVYIADVSGPHQLLAVAGRQRKDAKHVFVKLVYSPQPFPCPANRQRAWCLRLLSRSLSPSTTLRSLCAASAENLREPQSSRLLAQCRRFSPMRELGIRTVRICWQISKISALLSHGDALVPSLLQRSAVYS